LSAARIIRLESKYDQSHDGYLPLAHHDALEFPNGQIVLLTDLFEGQEATVLQLPAQPAAAAEVAAQERVAYVG
jgi:hypothetical protein